MRNFFRTTALAAALLATFSTAQAAVQTYSLSGSFDSGAYIGQSFSGMFSFDDASLTGSGDEWLNVTSLSLNLLGSNWTLADAIAPAEVGYAEGSFLGLSYSADGASIGFSFVPGFSDTSDAFVAYTPAVGLAGTGNVIYAPVPEADSYAMLLAGLGMLGLIARRRAKGF